VTHLTSTESWVDLKVACDIRTSVFTGYPPGQAVYYSIWSKDWHNVSVGFSNLYGIKKPQTNQSTNQPTNQTNKQTNKQKNNPSWKTTGEQRKQQPRKIDPRKVPKEIYLLCSKRHSSHWHQQLKEFLCPLEISTQIKIMFEGSSGLKIV